MGLTGSAVLGQGRCWEGVSEQVTLRHLVRLKRAR